MNYNDESDMFKKGSVIYRDVRSRESTSTQEAADDVQINKPNCEASSSAMHNNETSEMSKTQKKKKKKRKWHVKASITVEHTDIIKDEFWDQRPWLL